MRYLISVCLLLSIGCGSSESDPLENMMNDDGQGGAAGTEPLGGETPNENMGGEAGDPVTENTDQNMGGEAGDPMTENPDQNMGGEAGDPMTENPDENMGGGAGENVNEMPDEEEPIGAPIGESIEIDHATVSADVQGNLTLHINEIDDALDMLSNSEMLDTIIGLLTGDEDEEDSEGDDEFAEEDDDGLEIDLTGLRDEILEIISDRLLVADRAQVSEDGKTVVYTVDADEFCADDDDGDDSESPEELEDYMECTARFNAQPLVIHVSSDGAGKINLAVAVGNHLPEEMSIQIHDDLISVVASMQAATSFLRLFIDEESLALPDVFEGRVGLEARREGSRHFAVRTSILESLSVPAAYAEGLILELEAQSAPLTLLLNGPANTIDASLGLGTLEAELPWQLIVDFLHDDSGEFRSECFSNEEQFESCSSLNYCFESTYGDLMDCSRRCDEDGLDLADLDTCNADCERQFDDGQATCVATVVDVDVQSIAQDVANCLNGVSDEDCNEFAFTCRSGLCVGDVPRYSEVCEYRHWCEDVFYPAEEPNEVSGQVKVFAAGLGGSLIFDGTEDVIRLENAHLGNETLSISVDDDQIIGVTLNPDNEGVVSAGISHSGPENFEVFVSPSLDMSVALTLRHVWSAFVDTPEDLPTVLSDDVLGIRFDGSDQPSMALIGAGDDREMTVSSGTLSLSSPNMAEPVVIGEGMCMGSLDEDGLTDEEKDALHDLFGGLIEVQCGGD